TVAVTTSPSITVDAIGVGVAVGAAGAFAGAVAAGGAFTTNHLHGVATALVENTLVSQGLGVSAGGDVLVTADDSSTIHSNATAAWVSVSVSLGPTASFAISFAEADNALKNTVRAATQTADVTALAGQVEVKTTETSHVVSAPAAAAVSLAVSISPNFSVSGAAAAAIGTNTTAVQVEASVTGGTIKAGTAVTVKADDTSTIAATVVG